MSALDVLNAERIKLSTIRSPIWSGLAGAVCSLAVAVLQGRTAQPGTALAPQSAVVGVAVFGVPIAMVLAAMTVTGEYRTGMIRATFAAVPNRAMVLVAKAVVAAVFSGIFAAVLTVAAVAVARLSSDPLVGAPLSLASADVWRTVGAMSGYAMLAAVLGVGVGALLRHTAGAVGVLLLWPLVVEPIVVNLPDLGRQVGPFLPFGNAFAFTGVQWLYPSSELPWGGFGALLYFVVFVAAVFGGAVVLVDRRDA